MQGHSRSWGGFVLVLALGAALLGACKGATPEDQTRSAGVISTVLSSRPGAPHGVAMEVNFNQSRFTSYYRVWYRLSEIAQGDNASKAFKVKTSGSNCGVFGGEPSPFNNSKPEDLRHDDDYSPGYSSSGALPTTRTPRGPTSPGTTRTRRAGTRRTTRTRRSASPSRTRAARSPAPTSVRRPARASARTTSSEERATSFDVVLRDGGNEQWLN